MRGVSVLKASVWAGLAPVWVASLVAVLSACAPQTSSTVVSEPAQEKAAAERSLNFAPIGVPLRYSDKVDLKVSKRVSINGHEYPVTYTPLMTTGDQDNGEIYGLLKDRNGHPITFEDGSQYLCNGTNAGRGSGLDHFSILQRNGRLFMVSQFECATGAMYVNELSQDEQGILRLVPNTLRYIDQSSEFGGYVHCAGMTTPWQSHLGSEEYEPDAREVQTALAQHNENDLTAHYRELKSYWGDYRQFSPYYYGWIPEVMIGNTDEIEYTKHYAMGRFSHELAYVMPDEKTVYLSDDGTNVGLFMFVADTPKDLSAGTLYAAKWTQTNAEGAGSANLSWISLGHATDEAIRVQVARKLQFSDVFETAQPKLELCPAGFHAANTSAGLECLKLKDVNGDGRVDRQDDVIASRLESRRMAALKGATTEFRKMEGITFDADRGQVYLAMSSIEKGMENRAKKGKPYGDYDLGGANDIRLNYNPCGAVYRLSVEPNDALHSNYVAVSAHTLLAGKPDQYSDPRLSANKCDLDGIANPDNISYLPHSNTLMIGEDSSKHENNFVWQYDLETGTLTRILSAPLEAETTSVYWQDNVGGKGYLSVVVQHPLKSKSVDEIGGAVHKQSQAGVLGPFEWSGH